MSILHESVLDYINPNSLEEFKQKLIGKPIEHKKYGEGKIIGVDIDDDLDVSGLMDSDWGSLDIDFEDEAKTFMFSDHSPYLIFNEDVQRILREFKEEILRAKEAETKAREEEAIERAIKWAEKHFADFFYVWYEYLTGKRKNTPNDFDFTMNKEAYVKRFDELKDGAKRRRRIVNSFNDVDGTIEDTYKGDVKELVTWIKDHLKSIVISPSRELSKEEGEESVKAILDYLRDTGSDLDKVSIGHSGGAMKNYDMQLEKDALDSCPDLENFMTWKAFKYDMKAGAEVEMPVYDQNAESISSRRVVLDYLLNRDKYMED